LRVRHLGNDFQFDGSDRKFARLGPVQTVRKLEVGQENCPFRQYYDMFLTEKRASAPLDVKFCVFSVKTPDPNRA